jgi:Tol biopolymer transport system component
MGRFWKQGIVMVLLAATVGVWCLSPTLAAKPGGGPTPAQLNPAIAFVAAQSSGREDIVVAAADLASEIVLTQSLKPRKGGRLGMGSPAWSPDGKSVAFWVRDWLSPSDVKLKLYMASADGSGLTLLRDFSAQPGPFPSDNFLPSDGLNWSPTGKELVYTHGGLCAFDLASRAIRVLLANNNRIGHPALSPDRDLDLSDGYQGLLATIGIDETGAPGVFIVPIEGDANGYLLPIEPALFENVTVTPKTGQLLNPSWSPDGAEIAYFDSGDLAVLDVASGQKRILPGGFFTSAAAQERAAWTADGLSLVYRSAAIGTTDLAIIAADGGGAPQRYTLTTNRVEYAPAWNPQWDPDGLGGF